jgi:hypothetical protein
MATTGRKTWVVAGGHIPLLSSGPEPECTSRDELYVLNASASQAQLAITIYYSDRDPIGPYQLVVEAKRVRHVRFNDLIDPEALPLDTPYAAVIRSDVPVVAQFGRLDSSRGSSFGFATNLYSEP